MDGRLILLPLPPSENERLMPARFGRRLINSPAYGRWLNYAVSALKKGALPMFSSEKGEALFVYTVLVYQVALRDVTNYEKPLYDAMQHSGTVFINDRQIKERHTKGILRKASPCEYVICYLLRQKDLPEAMDFRVSEEQLARFDDYILRGAQANGRKVHP